MLFENYTEEERTSFFSNKKMMFT